ncbi:hypothetical protein EWM64_g1711 [Hericium alpestre]|uniref:Uncharacterized protein n=1 Tax=Hericium alpestre TaxID=135208 RepID=A0A4Z0A7H7_9AGAM|nr:hypothetical protein EWM64_g1711 [Hericium alpestre]
MSTPSYRLEAPRRPPPPPLRLNNSGRRSSSLAGSSTPSSEPLLYDLPAPGPSSSLISPTSPSPLSSVVSSTQPVGIFRLNPRTPRYYDQDEESGRLMTHTLATLPPSQRAPYAKLQGSVRSAYHASINARRTAEFRAHLSATTPGASLMPHSRADPHGSQARKERIERFERFVGSWCTLGMPGTKPFFEGLWAVMRLQVVPENLGGAGPYRIEWEIDDAVFQEAAGKNFMLEAINVLKGVSSGIRGEAFQTHFAFVKHFLNDTRSVSNPLSVAITAAQFETPDSGTPDPFLDTPAPSRSYASSSTQSTRPSSASPSDTPEEPPSPITPPADVDSGFMSAKTPTIDLGYQPEAEEAHFRTWTSPDLTNPEYLELLKIFPTFISRRTLPRFPDSTASRRPYDIEEGQEASAMRDEIRIGTGKMWRYIYVFQHPFSPVILPL